MVSRFVRTFSTPPGGRARKTRRVYRANLNFKIVKKYLSVLLGNGLLEVDTPFYSSTEKR